MINTVEKEVLPVLYLVDETDDTIIPNPDHCSDSNLREDRLTKTKSARLMLYIWHSSMDL